LRAYLRDARFHFDLPLAPAPTAFQARVRRGMLRIPAGRTLTYGELARRLASSARAVGGACRGNPLPVVVPCHRVVGANGPGGFMGCVDGAELGVKRWLLEHERR
jgi:methylated-DNA-[protein]-cysteine S-methyltransferase